MATKEDMNRFMGKVMADSELKRKTIATPLVVAKENGLELTPEQEKMFTEGIKAIAAFDNVLTGGCYYKG